MKQITVTKLTCSLFIFFLLVACTEAEVIGGNHSGQQTGEVETTFNLEVTPSQSPVTRSITFTAQGSTTVDTLAVGETSLTADTLQTRSVTDLPDAQEKKIAGLWIGQYDADGKILSHQYIESVTGTKVTAKLVATTGNCNVRFVANAGDLGNINTEALLNATTLSYASTDDGRPASNLFAMTGAWTGIISGETTQQTIPAVKLTRLAAKITFTYKINGTGFSFEPTSVSLVNAPDHSQIGELTTQLSSGIPYGTYTGTTSTTGATMYWYLPENMAGTATPAVNSEKEKTGQGVTNPTYIELFGNAVQNGVKYENVAFRFYPGKDANDYNIKRNDHFIMSIDLKGLDISDKRITVDAIPPITVSPEGNLPAAAGGTQEVQITSRAGVVWSLPLPQWLSATIDGQTTPPGSTLTNQGPCKVTFTTTETNPNATTRSQQFTVDLDGKGTFRHFALMQDPSSFSILSDTLQISDYQATFGIIKIQGTSGLAWTIYPVGTTNGITPILPAADGTVQNLRFNAAYNPKSNRSTTFTVAVPGGNLPSATVVVKQPADPIVVINQEILQSYYEHMKSQNFTWSEFPPFDADGNDAATSHGVIVDTTAIPPTMTGSYTIQVQTTQPDSYTYKLAQNHCAGINDGHTDWRLPTQIELYAIWDKCKGDNASAADEDYASTTLGASFISNVWYWSSSTSNISSSGQCTISLGSGRFNNRNTIDDSYVRCVRNN